VPSFFCWTLVSGYGVDSNDYGKAVAVHVGGEQLASGAIVNFAFKIPCIGFMTILLKCWSIWLSKTSEIRSAMIGEAISFPPLLTVSP
jgi:hypothetical protein